MLVVIVSKFSLVCLGPSISISAENIEHEIEHMEVDRMQPAENPAFIQGPSGVQQLELQPQQEENIPFVNQCKLIFKKTHFLKINKNY